MCQFFRWAAVALNKRGYQASGTVMVRPSRRATLRVSLVNFTSATRSSAASAKMPMPSLQECRFMCGDQFLNPPHLPGREPEVPREPDRLQPELGREIVPIDMDMRRLMQFVAVEVKAVRTGPQDSRHEILIAKTLGPPRRCIPAHWAIARIITAWQGPFNAGKKSTCRSVQPYSTLGTSALRLADQVDDRFQERLVVEAALGQVAVGPGVQTANPVLFAVLVRDDHHRERLEPGVLLDVRDELDAVHPGMSMSLSTRSTLEGLTATTSASSIMKASRR